VILRPGRVTLARMEAIAGKRPRLVAFDERMVGDSPAEVLRVLRREHGLDRLRCTTVLPQGEYQFHVVEAPAVPDAELKTAVRWHLKDLIDYPPDEAVVDVMPLPKGLAPGRGANVIAVAAHRDRVSHCIRTFDEAKLDLGAIDILETVQRNVASHLADGERAVALLVFGGGTGMLTVSAGGALLFARSFDLGLTQFTDAEHNAPDQAALCDRVALEVQRSLDHFDRQFGGLPLSSLLIAPFAQAEALRAPLAENLYVPVAVADLAAVLDFSAVPALGDPNLQGRHLRLLGAALRGG
jgi:MSHA biogenesis protein MshI